MSGRLRNLRARWSEPRARERSASARRSVRTRNTAAIRTRASGGVTARLTE